MLPERIMLAIQGFTVPLITTSKMVNWAQFGHFHLGCTLVASGLDIVAKCCHMKRYTVKPWIESIIGSGSMLVIQSTCISKQIFP